VSDDPRELIQILGDSQGTYSPATDDVIIDGNIITAENYAEWARSDRITVVVPGGADGGADLRSSFRTRAAALDPTPARVAEDVLGHGFAATNLAGDVLIALESGRSRLGALDLVSWDAHEQELTLQLSDAVHP